MVDICEFASSIIVEIKERFPNPKLLSAMKILNPQEWPKDKESLMFYGELELEELVSVYGKKYLPDYPLGLIDSVAVQEEWFGFKIVVHSNYQDLAIDDLFPLLYDNYLDSYPNILKLMEIVYSIPFSSVDCERGFSKQNIIKTDLCTAMENDRLHLLLMVGYDFRDALSKFLESKNRRMK